MNAVTTNKNALKLSMWGYLGSACLCVTRNSGGLQNFDIRRRTPLLRRRRLQDRCLPCVVVRADFSDLQFLSQVLVKEDVYQAKFSLQTVIDNYEGEVLKGIAQEKLNLILNQEKKEVETLEKAQKELEVNFEDMEDYDHLFEEEEIEE